MINKIKKNYPNYLIFIKIKNDIYDLDFKKVDKKVLKNNPYILVEENSYEVHNKVKFSKKCSKKVI